MPRFVLLLLWKEGTKKGRRKETLVVCVAGLLGLRRLLLLLGFCSFPASEIFWLLLFWLLGLPGTWFFGLRSVS